MIEIKDLNIIPDVMAEIRDAKKSVEAGILSDESEELRKIAGVHEFGAKIRMTDKMRKYIFWLINSLGLSGTGYTAKNPGFVTIPERSFIRATADRETTFNKIVNVAEKSIDMVFSKLKTGKSYRDSIGLVTKEIIKENIEAGRVGRKGAIPLAELTVKKKGNSKLLIDKGNLLNSVKYK